MPYRTYEHESFWSRAGYWITRGVTWPFRTEENRHIAWKVAKPAVAVLLLIYFGYMVYNFVFFWGREIHYPERVLRPAAAVQVGDVPAGPEIVSPSETCVPSKTIEMQIHLIDLIVNRNDWVPSNPVFKLGVVGLVDWEDTPWFDNKKSEQIGILNVLRRFAIEYVESLGRHRGTSEANETLNGANNLLRIAEDAWWINSPLNRDVNTISPSAESSYRRAIGLYQTYNRNVASCQAIFDTRPDNLRTLLDRISALIGSTTAELAERTRAWTYDPESDQFVQASGNNRGWFDLRADNFLYRARGEMYALHGLMQAVRVDFAEVLEQSNVDEVWDRMERALAEAASMEPPIASNGGHNSIIMPDHLAIMGQLIFRARAPMTEIRDVIRQ